MSFTDAFMPVLGAGVALFLCGILWQLYRFVDLVLTGATRRR